MDMQLEIDLNRDGLEQGLLQIADSEHDAIVVSSCFTPDDLTSPFLGQHILPPASERVLKTCAQSLRTGGLLFIYGAPRFLPAYAQFLETLDDECYFEFKYWIAVQLHECRVRDTLYSSHVGILLYHKLPRKGTKLFNINTSFRIPHAYCSACNRNLRDWGGKKHLMNPNGAALSDVWTDFPVRPLTDNRIPQDVLERVIGLAGGRAVHVVESVGCESQKICIQNNTSLLAQDLDVDKVEVADCIEFLEGLLPKYEHGAFDLVFADPPYNLSKLYSNYSDTQAAEKYVAWCDRWLELCARLLKAGGSLFALNIPRWALSHARTLDKQLQFRHWIVWHALAEPRGKLLPAHYALLHYTKDGAPVVFNYSDFPQEGMVSQPDSPEYCLRASCIKTRKSLGNDKKVPLTDIWFDIHRIKHKRDRDYHPCQLPEKLLERIILLSSNPGQVVFDPFCGVGTTAIVAKRLGRHYITTDIDPTYVRITENKIEQMERNRTLFGGFDVPRIPVHRPARLITKKYIESIIQQLARELGRTPELEDIRKYDAMIYEEIPKLYSNPRKALGAARVVLNR